MEVESGFMEKIIVRKKILDLGFVNSNFVRLNCNNNYSSKSKLIKDLGWQKTMKTLFAEDIDSIDIKSSSLYQSYENFLNSNQIENENFIKVYKIDDSFGLYLDANIFLYHLFVKDNIGVDIVPWYYSDGQIYLGDTWWEDDEEILNNIKTLSVIDFYKRYKGWGFSAKKLF